MTIVTAVGVCMKASDAGPSADQEHCVVPQAPSEAVDSSVCAACKPTVYIHIACFIDSHAMMNTDWDVCY